MKKKYWAIVGGKDEKICETIYPEYKDAWFCFIFSYRRDAVKALKVEGKPEGWKIIRIFI